MTTGGERHERPVTPADVRVCAVGDSFVAGVGDGEHLGWVGRLAARSHAAGHPLTSSPLGVRGATSTEVLARWRAECAPRLPARCSAGVVVSCGVNDTAAGPDGAPRVPPEVSAANLDALLLGAADAGWSVLVVGPPPVDDAEQERALTDLDRRFAAVCAARGVPHAPVLEALRAAPVWLEEARAGDGAHPGAGGYAAMAEHLWHPWSTWLGQLRG